MFSFIEIIHVVIIVQSFSFAIQLLTFKDSQLKSGKIIGGMMLVLFFYYMATFILNTKLDDLRFYSILVIPLLLAYPPFYYIYVKSITTPLFKLKIQHANHFIPFFVFFIINTILFFLILFVDENLSSATNIIYVRVPILIYLIQIIGYAIVVIILLRKHSKNINNYFSYEQNISLSWLKVIIVIITLTALIEVLTMFSLFSNIQHIKTIAYIFSLLSINFWGYFALRQKDIYHKEESNTTIYANNKNSTPPDKELMTEKEHIISEEEQKQIVQNVLNFIESEKSFLDPQLTIHDLALKLGTNKTYVSISINNILKKNFKILINEYRINEAIKMFKDEQYNNISTEGIGFNVGYISKSTFTNYFKQFTNQTPASYRKEVNPKRSE